MFEGQVAVAGHICLDIIPMFGPLSGGAIPPGTLVRVGAAQLATGGAVANVGLALHRLGATPRLVGKVGDDRFGAIILDLLRANDARLAEGMVVAPGEVTSYSVVINPLGVDRTFLHCPGANDSFGAADLLVADLTGVKLLHFGYPPLMHRIAADNGMELAELLAHAKAQGITTALDMAWPDPATQAGHIDWPALLRRCLPLVDVFLPNVGELLWMLDPSAPTSDWTVLHIIAVAEQCLRWGTALVGMKLGDQGCYLQATADTARWQTAGLALAPRADHWQGRQLLAPCFQATVRGTTGAGDATIAGLLLAVLSGQSPEDALTSAVAVGACSVEAADAVSAIPLWDAVQAHIQAGWERLPFTRALTEWQWEAVPGIWRGPHDQKGPER